MSYVSMETAIKLLSYWSNWFYLIIFYIGQKNTRITVMPLEF